MEEHKSTGRILWDYHRSIRKKFLIDQANLLEVVQELNKEINTLEKKGINHDFISKKKNQLDKIIEFYDNVESYIISYDQALQALRVNNTILEQLLTESFSNENLSALESQSIRKRIDNQFNSNNNAD